MMGMYSLQFSLTYSWRCSKTLAVGGNYLQLSQIINHDQNRLAVTQSSFITSAIDVEGA